MTTKKRIQELLRKREHLNGIIALTCRERVEEFITARDGVSVNIAALTDGPSGRAFPVRAARITLDWTAANVTALMLTGDGVSKAIVETDADGKSCVAFLRELDAAALESLCKVVDAVEAGLETGAMAIEKSVNGTLVRWADIPVDDSLRTRRQVFDALCGLVSQYGKQTYDGIFELATFGICSDEGVDLSDSTIDKVVSDGCGLKFYYNENTGDCDEFSVFPTFALREFYLGLRKALESGGYDREED